MSEAFLSLLWLTIQTYRRFSNEAVDVLIWMKANPENPCHFQSELGKTGRNKRNKWGQDSLHKSCSVAVRVWCQPVPAPAAFTVHCAGLPGKQLQPRTWPRLFTVPPSVKRVMLSVLNGQRFSLCARSKQRAKLVSKLHSFCILVLRASFVWSLAQCFTPLLTWLACWR